MKKSLLLFCCLLFITLHQLCAQTTGVESRMNEVFQVTELTHASPNTRFYDPWEVTYGPDDSLWITEAKNYKVYKMSPSGSTPRMILNISPGSTFLPAQFRYFNLSFPAAESTFLDGGFTKGATAASNSAPQGGLAGLAIHPKFLSGSPYVFVSYVWKFVKNLSTANKTISVKADNSDTVITTTTGTPANGGVYYKNALVRFKYESTTGLLDSPMTICDTLPGSSDHNSQRIIVAPINGVYYLFYANGDMGAGQFGNAARVENAQNLDSYEGKILRFNVDPDNDADSIDKWIPNTNPFNGVMHAGVQSAIWAFGFRNNQGFGYARINNTDYLYGQMHGPFSDDEINVIHGSGNYGHPLVEGYKTDENYDSTAAGVPYTNWTGTYAGIKGGLPIIYHEKHNADSLNQYYTYYDPIFTFYPATNGSGLMSDLTKTTVVPSEMASQRYMYYWFNQGQQSNTYWPSEAPSGMDVYTNSMIPGWKNSLLSAVMKGAPNNTAGWTVQTSGSTKGAPAGASSSTGAAGKIMRLKLNTNGDQLAISPTNASDSTLKTASTYADDTVSYFAAQNRFRDLAISKDGLSFYTIIDSSSTTSGPTSTNPANSLCKGCLIKYTFLGYNSKTVAGKTTSSLPDTIAVSSVTTGTCVSANPVVINSANNNTNVWVPITDTNSNIVAEIYANGNNLDSVYTSYYVNGGAVRKTPKNTYYLDRNITITPKTQPTGNPVRVRLYITNSELNALVTTGAISTVAGLGVFKTHNTCGSAYVYDASTVTLVDTPFTRTTASASTGFAIQTSVTSFSTFYFANSAQTLPITLSLTGFIKNNISQLQWTTENETGTREFAVERSIDGVQFDSIGVVEANGTDGNFTYTFSDASIKLLSCPAVYYRLKVVDVSSDFSYSNIIELPLNGPVTSISVHPNPAVNSTTVQINIANDDVAKWNLIDNTGSVYLHGSAVLRKGNNSFNIDVSSLPKGVYYLRLGGNYINEGIKIEKL